VARGVVPEPLLAAGRREIGAFLGVDPDGGPERWYPRAPLEWGVVPLHHAQALWDLRQHPRVHRAFAQVRGTERLWVSIDRAIYRVPASEAHPDHVDRSQIHWDLDPRPSVRPWRSYQGMLFLTDAPADQGPFECVPSVFEALQPYLDAHPELDLEAPLDLVGHEVVAVTARAGDLVIWDSRLPHRGGPNRGRAPRVSVPIAMWPEGDDAERSERIACWRERRAPEYWRGWPGQLDPEPGPPTELSPLGRLLLGLDRW
jgi:hypothetical protein